MVDSECCISSVCETCLDSKTVCDKCKQEGQISYCPLLRACKRCLENHVQCVKFIVLTWSIDCESGNRKMADLVAEKPIQFLEYLVVFPDVVHLAKTYKCSWSNWFLILGEGDRSTLGTLRMLRNEIYYGDSWSSPKHVNCRVSQKQRQDGNRTTYPTNCPEIDRVPKVHQRHVFNYQYPSRQVQNK